MISNLVESSIADGIVAPIRNAAFGHENINFKLTACLHAEKGGFVKAARVGEGLV